MTAGWERSSRACNWSPAAASPGRHSDDDTPDVVVNNYYED
ncbi:hypothetical protein ACIHEI_35120 [Kitasatospora sp. NPDC051984]